MSDETLNLPALTHYEIQLLILGLQANARNLEEYGRKARIPAEGILRQNRESRRLELMLRKLLPEPVA